MEITFPSTHQLSVLITEPSSPESSEQQLQAQPQPHHRQQQPRRPEPEY